MCALITDWNSFKDRTGTPDLHWLNSLLYLVKVQSSGWWTLSRMRSRLSGVPASTTVTSESSSVPTAEPASSPVCPVTFPFVLCLSVFYPHTRLNASVDRLKWMIRLMSDSYKVTASTYRDRELIKMKERVMEWRRGRADLSVVLNNEPTDGREVQECDFYV